MALNPLYSEIPENLDFLRLAENILGKIHAASVPVLKREIEKQGMVLNGKLLTSLSRSVKIEFQEQVVNFVIGMEAHGMYKDAKRIRYAGRPNADDFLGEVEKSFGRGGYKEKLFWRSLTHIPGYPNQDASDVIGRIGELKALKRIASAAIVSIGKQATITRNVQGGWQKPYFEEVIGKMNLNFEILGEAIAMKESERILKNASNGR